MYVAVDDTDSSTWMCTTFLATELIRALDDLDLIGFPRLVRLNPAVPWKTRGNGALCIRVGKGSGKRQYIGNIANREIFCYETLEEEPEMDEVFHRSVELVKEWSQTDHADPGLVVCKETPHPSLYEKAVHRIISKEEVISYLNMDHRLFQINKGRGIIGAAASISWVPDDYTYEILAYRERVKWGTQRYVDAEDVRQLDTLFPSTFNNFDEVLAKPAIVPNTSCPILYGVRGDSYEDLLKVREHIHSENVDRWLIYQSNQGTDDHVIYDSSVLQPNSSYALEGTIASFPSTVQGGHVIIVVDVGEKLECAAYEPSKDFRKVIRALRPGDRVKIFGELRETPRTLNIEKLQVISLAKSLIKTANPRCAKCGRSMRSIGAGQGYRCKKCGTKSNDVVMEEEARTISVGWYEPPVCSRRHLSKPLKRCNLE
ncbi:TiaS agmantine-binding domain-containing protein [Candidatus Methanomassiliicoccus intestinalis]|uniref:TiaS agmantine-binding domain-containing protein n=1 Tax=Candidatus Methanomassiliicoccus intestinalis TaxID=1406512 RepID=UPI0037DCBC0B